MRLAAPSPRLRRWRLPGPATLLLVLVAALVAAGTQSPAAAQDAGEPPARPDSQPVAGAVELVDIGGGCSDEAVCPHAPTGRAAPGPEDGQITVTWTAATTGGFVTEWIIAIRESGSTGDWSELHVRFDARSHTFTDLDTTRTYDVRVQGLADVLDATLRGDVARADAVAALVPPIQEQPEEEPPGEEQPGESPAVPPPTDCPETWEMVLWHGVEHLCDHENLPHLFTPRDAHALLRAGFTTSEFQWNQGIRQDGPDSNGDEGEPYINCGPGMTPTDRTIQLPRIPGVFNVGCETVNESRRLDYVNHKWGSDQCGPGREFAYFNGGNGGVVCAETWKFVNCAPGNEAGVTGRRCLRDKDEAAREHWDVIDTCTPDANGVVTTVFNEATGRWECEEPS